MKSASKRRDPSRLFDLDLVAPLLLIQTNGSRMRLDLFLKASRLCAGRSSAQKLCDAGLVSLNNKPAKSAHAVKPGDQIEIKTRTRLLVVVIEAVPATRNTARKEATALYRVIEDERLVDDATTGSDS